MDVLHVLTENCTAVLATSTICILAFCLIRFRRPRNFPPGPNGIPLFGVLPFLRKRPDKQFAEYARTYGDVMGVSMGTHYALVLSSNEVLVEALSRQGEYFSARPSNYANDFIWRRNGIAMTDFSSEWKEQRKFTLTALRRFGWGKSALEGPICDETRYLADALRKCKGDYKHAKSNLMHAGANVICKLVLDNRFDYEEDSAFMSFAHNITERMQKAAYSVQASTLQPLCHPFPPFRTPLRELKELFDELHSTLQDYVEKHKEAIDVNHPRDFLDEYLIATSSKTEKNIGLFSEKMLRFIMRDLFFGGLETFYSILTWTLLIMSNRPELQLKLQAEVDDIVGREGCPTIKQKENMHLVMAFMHELLRYRTLLPFGVARMTTRDVKLRGYDIPKGTIVIPNLYAVHNDPKLWDKPHEFRIERHLNENGEFVSNPNVVPFGVGYRYCLGKQVAEMEYFLFFVSFLQNFDVQSGTGEWQYEDALECGFVSVPPPSTVLKLVERV